MIETFPFKKVLDGITKLNDLKKELSDVEFKEALVALKSDLIDAQEDNLRLRAENLELKAELDQIEKNKELDANTIEVSGFLYDEVNGQPVGLPFCPTCLVKEEKRYRLARGNENYSNCPNCKTTHNAAMDGRVNMRNPPPKRVRNSRYFDS